MNVNPSPTINEVKKQEPRFIIGVRVMGGDKTEFFNPGTLQLRVGTHVMLESRRTEKHPPHGAPEARRMERLGVIASNKIANLRTDLQKPLLRVLRVATPADLETYQKRAEMEDKAIILGLEKVAKLNLPMNLSRAIYLPESRKTIFYFTAEGRVDFRELVKELVQNLKTKIEMRQVGVRDEAKAITGYGVCGESLCCSTFLREFFPVTVRMAKDQGLALNPSKISGVCGRLMCCLQYEHDSYREQIKTLPKNNARVETPTGPGKVLKNDILQQKVTVRLDDESIATYHVSELNILPRQDKPNPPPQKKDKR